MTFARVGERVEIVGIGKMFVNMVEGATGKGRVVHVGIQGVTETAENFHKREQYETLFPAQYHHGIFYMDEGLAEDSPYNPLFSTLEDAEVIPEEEPENEE